jgi:hypothetical protein
MNPITRRPFMLQNNECPNCTRIAREFEVATRTAKYDQVPIIKPSLRIH